MGMKKYVSELNSDELNTLEAAIKNHPSARVRSRAHVITLSNRHYRLKEIADICQPKATNQAFICYPVGTYKEKVVTSA